MNVPGAHAESANMTPSFWTDEVNNVWNLRGLPMSQLRTIVLSVQAKTELFE